MTSKISTESCFKKSVTEKPPLELILEMRLSANLQHSGWPQWTASRKHWIVCGQ